MVEVETKETYPFVIVMHMKKGQLDGLNIYGPYRSMVDSLAQAYQLADSVGKDVEVYRLDAFAKTKEGVEQELQNSETANRMTRFK